MPESDKENQKTEIEILKEKLAAAEKEKNEYLDGWKRAKADLINYKKEEANRFQDFVHLSVSVFMRELITVLDSFDSGLAALKDDEPAHKGLALIRSKFFDILKKFGLEEITVRPGQPFDPAQQEGVGETESSQLAGMIAEVVEKGYLLNGRVLKPAKVKLSKQNG